MSRLTITTRALFDLRWQVFWYGIGLAVYGGGMVWFYPLFEDALEGLTEGYPEEILQFFGPGDIMTPAGFITIEYQTFAVLILMVYAVVAATGQLAGEEGRGTLEGLLAQPVTRARLMIEKAIAVLVAAVGICLVICLGWLLSVPFVDLHGEVTLLDMAGATFGALPVVAFTAALGFLLGALAPSRGAAAGVLTAFVVFSFLAASLANVIEAIEWMRFVSPYHYSDATRWLIEGPVLWHQMGLVLGALGLFALALVAFHRREIAVGTWQIRSIFPRPAAA